MSNLITWNLAINSRFAQRKTQNKYISSTLINANVKCLQYVSRSLRLVHKKKRILTFFQLNFLSNFTDMYRMDTVFSLILLVSEMLKILRAKVEAHFLRNLLL